MRPETLVRLRQAGVDVAGQIVVAVGAIAGRPDLVEIARSMLEDLAAQVGPPVVGVTVGRAGRGAAAGRRGRDGRIRCRCCGPGWPGWRPGWAGRGS